VTLGLMLKLLLDTRQQVKYKDFDELRYIMAGALFFTSLVLVLLPAEVNVTEGSWRSGAWLYCT
jgi:hypothetical protein